MHPTEWLAHERNRELRHQAAEARRARVGRGTPARPRFRRPRPER